MKLHGKEIERPEPVFAVFQRGDNELVIQCEAVYDHEPFEKVCPVPKPPKKVMKGGIEQVVLDDPDYLQRVDKHSERQFAWLVISSISNTPGLEWETVDINKPSTWESYQKEMRESGFLQAEINEIVARVLEANAMDESRMEEARQRFLRLRAEESN